MTNDGTDHVRFREATSDDVAAFARFFWRAWKEAEPGAAGFTGATDEIIAELTTPEAIRARLGGPERRMFFAWDSDEVVGFSATRRMSAGSVELAGIIVLQSHSGRGIGSGLIDEAINCTRAEDYRKMIVRTEVTNQRARAFYEASNFVDCGSTTEDVEGEVVEVAELARDIA